KPLGDARYLLSPEDLYAIAQIPEIVRIGISAVKIEGRYKAEDYVALTTRAYRKAVDEAWAELPSTLTAADELRLHQVYSRGFGPHFLTGTNHQTVVNGRAPRHRGVRMGRVVRLAGGAVILRPEEANSIAPLKPGDGVVLDAADWRSPEEPEEGGRVYEVASRQDGTLELRFANDALDFTRIRPGDLLWRTDDPEIARLVRPFTQAPAPVDCQPVDVRVTAREGAPLEAEWMLVNRPGIRVAVASQDPLQAAQNQPLDPALLREQFGRLGGTPYALAAVELDSVGKPFAPASLLNQMRREAVERLTALQGTSRHITVQEPIGMLEQVLAEVGPGQAAAQGPAQLHLLVRTTDQLDAALAIQPASITLDYLDLYGLQPSVERVQASGIPLRIASPRILKPGEEAIVRFLVKLACPILVRSTGLLHALRGQEHPELTGDFSLNAANVITARTLLDGVLSRLTPTHDLNAAQVLELARGVGPALLELVAYQHIPVFHTEHCVFCRFLSTGTSYRDCGRPCEKHWVSLRDANGRAHPVLADVGCRNTVFGAEAQEASAHLEAWLEAGIRHFRLEFAHESSNQVKRIAQAFREVVEGRRGARDLARLLRQIAPEGTTEGSLFVPEGSLVLPVLQ
ncbi:MAG: DUF3656 domain-containing protein, partial [Acidobacteria bacterium]|nr:DUF3656 domain-containing protein [Acidobacteriota bacterium]